MPEDTTTTDNAAANTPDAAVNNTDPASAGAGAGTDTAQQNQANEKTFTQAEVNAMIAQRLPKAVKAELKKMSGEGEPDKPGVEEYQRENSDLKRQLRDYEARDKVSSFLTDGRNKLNASADNFLAIQDLVIPRLEYDDDGNPTNMREAIELAKARYPKLFANPQPSINANNGNGQPAVGGSNWITERIQQARGLAS